MNRKPIYWGLLWNDLSSMWPPDSLVTILESSQITDIQITPNTTEIVKNETAITQISYHDIIQFDYHGEADPRSNPAIIQSLDRDGKLR